MHPAQVQYFISHSISLPSSPPISYSHLFAIVRWPQLHPQRHAMGKPVEVYCNNLFEPMIENHILSVQHIASRLAVAYDSVGDEEVLIIIPLLRS